MGERQRERERHLPVFTHWLSSRTLLQCSFNSFQLLIALTGTSSVMLNSSDGRWLLILILILRGKILVFCYWKWCYLWVFHECPPFFFLLFCFCFCQVCAEPLIWLQKRIMLEVKRTSKFIVQISQCTDREAEATCVIQVRQSLDQQ